MPDGLAAAMTPDERRDLVRFLLDLGRPGSRPRPTLHARIRTRRPTFPYDRAPLHPEHWPSWQHPVNRDRIYDFYAKEAEYFSKQPSVPALLPPFPGLDGGKHGHWGNQNEDDLGRRPLEPDRPGHGALRRLPRRGRDGPQGGLRPARRSRRAGRLLQPRDALLRGPLERRLRQVLGRCATACMDGLILDGTPLPRPEGKTPDKPFVYHGFYRHGKRVVFSYRIGDVEMLDAPWVEDGQFTRVVAPAAEHPLARPDARRRPAAVAAGLDDPRHARPAGRGPT